MSAELHYTDTGGSGEAVVLVHAIGCDSHMWDALEAALAPAHRIVRVDLRGHGASPVVAGPCSLEDLAGDVADVLHRLRLPRAHWVGLSLGGMLGLAFALAHPQRLGRLVLANTTAGYGPEGRALWQARARAVEDGGMKAIVDLAMERYFSAEFRTRQVERVASVAARFLMTPPQGYIAACAAIADLDYADRLGAIRAPTLVIAGGADVATPAAMSESLARGIGDARLAVIPGAAHLSAVEDPAAFNALVSGFLSAQ